MHFAVTMRGPIVLRNLDAPVRSLFEALEELTRKLLVEFAHPETTPEHQRWVADRLQLVRDVAGERNYAVMMDRVRSRLLAPRH
jgi:hypothetical protein